MDKTIPVYVPAGSVEAYQSTQYWNKFTNIQPIVNEYTLTVSYATLYLGYAVEIPEEVEVYTATGVEGTKLSNSLRFDFGETTSIDNS